MSLMDIKTVASELDEHERAVLAAWLLDSLPAPTSDTAHGDTLQDADKRRAELNSGAAVALSSEEFWQAIDSDESKCA